MKKITIIFVMIIPGMNIIAQGTNPNNDSTSTLKQRKNEIGINITPVLSTLLSSFPEKNRFSITYKRILNEKSAFRITAAVDQSFTSYSSTSEKSDTSIITYLNHDYISPHLNLGYERNFGKNKLKWFYGADLILGYMEERNSKVISNSYTDSISGSVYMEVNPKTTKLNGTKGYMIGISPFFGAKYSLSKRFSISAQVGSDMTYQSKTMILKDKYNIEKKVQVSTFDFDNSTGIINDISIIYKF